MDTQLPNSPSDPKPNTTKVPIRRRKLKRERYEKLYPNSTPLGKNHTHLLTDKGQIRHRLGITDLDMEGVPSISRRVKDAYGSIRAAVELLEGDDAPDSMKFMAKWNGMAKADQRDCAIEDVIIASGLTTRRFLELCAGAMSDHDDYALMVSKSRRKLRVLDSAFKAATDEVPITATDMETGEIKVIGHTNADVKAMELFFKLTGDIKPSGGAVVNLNSNNQTANITAAPDRAPLQTMDSWLLEIDDIRKPRQLNAPAAPVIPVEMPANAPEIEYLPISEEL